MISRLQDQTAACSPPDLICSRARAPHARTPETTELDPSPTPYVVLPYLTEPGAESPFVLSLLCDSRDEDTGAPAFSLEPVRPPQTEPTTDGPRPWRQPTPPSSPMTSPRLATKLTDAFAASAHYVCVQVRPETDWHTSRVTAPWSAAATPPTTEAFFGNLQVVSPPPSPPPASRSSRAAPLTSPSPGPSFHLPPPSHAPSHSARHACPTL